MNVQYPVIESNKFSYNKETNFFTAKFRTLNCDPVRYREFLMRSSKTGNEVVFLLISNIYDQDAHTCGWRFVPSYDDADRFPGLVNCFVDILLD